MMRLMVCFLAAQAILLPVYALYVWVVPGRAGAQLQWRLHRIAFLLAVVLPIALLVPLRLPAPPAVQHLAASVLHVSASPSGQKVARLSAARKAGVPIPSTLLLLIPAGGALVFFARLGRQKERERFLARTGVRRGHGRLEVIVTGAARVPFSTGLLRPRIFLPADVAGNSRTFSMVFRHEGVHLRRRDWLWTMCESLVVHVFWFNPMMHVLGRGGSTVRELLCDAEVCRRYPPAEYGRLLLETAAGARGVRVTSLVDAWIQRGTLRERIRFLVQGGRSFMNRRVRAASIAAGLLAAAFLMAGLPFLPPVGAQGRTHDTPNIESYPPVTGAVSMSTATYVSQLVSFGKSIPSGKTGLAMFDNPYPGMTVTYGGADFYVHVPDSVASATVAAFVEDVSTAADGTTTISIVTSSGYRIVYSNIAKPLVTFREFVRAGQTLGTLAPSANSLGEFSLHYEVWKDGRQIDPRPPSFYGISTGNSAATATTFSGTSFGEPPVVTPAGE